jgi:hypothetical protein
MKGLDLQRMDGGAFMENFSGAAGPGNSARRREVLPMFRPEESAGDNAMGGVPPLGAERRNEVTERYGMALTGGMAGVKPFEPVRVGPGLNAGYTAAPSGGVQQNDTRDYLNVRSVDDLRTADKPKLSMEGRVIPGAGMPQRGLVGEVAQNRPDTAFEVDRGFVGGRGMEKARDPRTTDGSDVLRKRSLAPEGFGQEEMRMGPGFGSASAGGSRALLAYPETRPREQRLQSESAGFGLGGGVSASRFAPGASVGGAPQPQGGHDSKDMWENFIGSAVGSGAHLSAAQPMRPSGRETTEENTMMFGNMSLRAPPRGPAYDPDHMTMRTTLKETAIHDTRAGNLGAGRGGVAAGHADNMGEGFDSEQSRHTMREFQAAGAFQQTVRNPRVAVAHDEDRTEGFQPPAATLRDTTASWDRAGSASMPGRVPGAYATNVVEVALTHRELTGQRQRASAPTAPAASHGGHGEPNAYVAQLDAMRGAGPGVGVGGGGNGMTASGLRGGSDFDYYGIPKSAAGGGMDYTQLYTATLNEAKQDVLRTRLPGGHGGGAKEAARAEHAGRGRTRADPAPLDRVEGPSLPSNARFGVGGSTVRSDRHEDTRLDRAMTSWVDDNPFVTSGVWNQK